MPPETLAIIFGLSSALFFGTADFIGGFTSKKLNSFSVLLISYMASLPFLFVLGVFQKAPLPPSYSLMAGALAGGCAMFAMGIFYRALATNRMGVVAPVTALVSAALPVLFGTMIEGLPTVFQIIGFILGFIAIWFLSANGSIAGISLRDLSGPILAGIFFGLYFVIMDQAVKQSIIWPLVASRTSGLLLLITALLTTRKISIPAIHKALLPLLSGFFDAAGGLFFALAATHGRLDIAGVLTAMYPAVTVLMAWVILKETLKKAQLLGLFAALVALAMIAV